MENFNLKIIIIYVFLSFKHVAILIILIINNRYDIIILLYS